MSESTFSSDHPRGGAKHSHLVIRPGWPRIYAENEQRELATRNHLRHDGTSARYRKPRENPKKHAQWGEWLTIAIGLVVGIAIILIFAFTAG